MKKDIFISLVLLLILIIQYNSEAKLIAYWNFDDGTANDKSGNGYHGTIMNNVQFVDGVYCKGARLVGSGYYYTSTPPGGHILLPKIDFSGWNELSLCMWVNEEDMTHYHGENYIFFGYNNDGWLGISNHFLHSDSKLKTSYAVGGIGDNNVVFYPFDYSNRNKWMFYCLTYKNGMMRTYVNCELVDSMETTINVSSDYFAAIGRTWWTYGSERRTSARFIGTIDEVMLFDHCLQHSEINEYCNIQKYEFKIKANQPLCPGDSLFLEAIPGNLKPVEYDWSGPGGFRSSLQNPVLVVDERHSGSFILKSLYKCQTSYDTVFVKVFGPEKPLILPEDPSFCKGNTITLSTSKKYNSYKWSNGSTKDNIIVDKGGKYWVEITDSNGCVGRDTIEVEVIDIEVFIEPQNPRFCKGASFEVYTSEPFLSYKWSTGETSRTITVKEKGTYYVDVTDTNGCKATASVVFDVYEIKPEFFSKNTICTELDSVKLELIEKYISYKWTTGEITSSIIVRKSGVYGVEVVDNKGCKGYAEVKVHFGPSPSPEIEIIGNHPFCDGEQIFLKTTKEYSGYRWNEGQDTRQISIRKAGSYRVVVTDENGCTGEAVIEIKTFPKPSPKINIIGENPFCQNDTIVLFITGKYDEILWSTGQKTDSITVKREGKYTVSVTDSNGCKASSELIIRYKKIEINIDIIGNYPFCEGDDVVLKTRNEFPSYLWSTQDTTREIIIRKGGKYFVTVVDASGCEFTSDTIDVLFTDTPDANINGPQYVCINSETKYWVSPIKGQTYWKVENGVASNLSNVDTIKVKWDKAGKGKITVMRKLDDSPCIAYDTLEVTISDKLYPEIEIQGNIFCEGIPVELKCRDEYETYFWSTGDSTRSIQVNAEGKYWVMVSSYGCEGVSDTIELMFSKAPIPKITGDTLLCFGQSGELRVEGDYVEFLWGDGETDREIIVSKKGKYKVTVTDEFGCKATAEIEVKFIEMDYRLSANIIDFKENIIYYKKNLEIKLTNNSKDYLRIERAYFKNNINSYKILTNPILPHSLGPNKHLTISIEFYPEKLGLHEDSLIIAFGEPCPEDTRTLVTGKSYSYSRVWMPDTIGIIGNKMCIPLYSEIINHEYGVPLKAPLELGFRAKIRFEDGLFYTENVNQGTITDKNFFGKTQQVEMDGKEIVVFQNQTELDSFCGRVLLGDVNKAQLIIEEFEWSSPFVYIEKKDGSLETKGLCVTDLSRVTSFQPTQMLVQPNPAQDKISVSINSEESGEFHLTLYNVTGSLIKSENWKADEASSKLYDFDLSSFQSGVYFLVLKSPWNVISEKVLIVK